ncbi:MAG: hypothetical protein M3Q45_10885 [Chloroflexota bacterium]|nr:hypothetical protein [Chloroflexota bacterium]
MSRISTYYPEFSRLLNHHLGAQDRSASWLAQQLGVYPSTVGRWLNDASRPSDPATVGRIADWLRVHNQTERQALFIAAGYAYIETGGATQPSENSQHTHSHAPDSDPVINGESNQPQVNLYHFQFFINAVQSWRADWFRLPPKGDHQSWGDWLMDGLGILVRQLNARRLLQASVTLALWILTAWALTPIWQWPLADPDVRGLACLRYGLATVVIPLLVAWVTQPADAVLLTVTASKQRQALGWLKVTGALIGFTTFAGLLLWLAIVWYYLAQQPLPAGIGVGLALAPLLFSHAAARRVPTDRLLMFGEIRPHEADSLFLAVGALLGPTFATFVYVGYPVLADPILGVLLLLVVIAAAFWAQRPQTLNALTEMHFIFVLGFLLPLCALLLVAFFVQPTFSLVSFDAALTLLLVVVYGLSETLLIATLLVKNKPIFRLTGAVGLLLVTLLANLFIRYAFWLGIGFLIVVALFWLIEGRRRYRNVLWVHGSFVWLQAVLLTSLYGLAQTSLPMLVHALSVAMAAGGLIIWAYRSVPKPSIA